MVTVVDDLGLRQVPTYQGVILRQLPDRDVTARYVRVSAIKLRSSYETNLGGYLMQLAGIQVYRNRQTPHIRPTGGRKPVARLLLSSYCTKAGGGWFLPGAK